MNAQRFSAGRRGTATKALRHEGCTKKRKDADRDLSETFVSWRHPFPLIAHGDEDMYQKSLTAPWRDDYNRRRPQSTLGCQTPAIGAAKGVRPRA